MDFYITKSNGLGYSAQQKIGKQVGGGSAAMRENARMHGLLSVCSV
jgi:hypothetical protein